MSQRGSLPKAATTIAPGYSWRIDLDMKFDDERPVSWSGWVVRMHIWDYRTGLTLTNGSGITFEPVEIDGGTVTVPVIKLTAVQTEALRGYAEPINYVIDFKAPGGEAEDYFDGQLTKAISPPASLLQP